jgi:hypothetical protein
MSSSSRFDKFKRLDIIILTRAGSQEAVVGRSEPVTGTFSRSLRTENSLDNSRVAND